MEYQPASYRRHGACHRHARPLDLREDRKQGERRAEREESNLRERDAEGREVVDGALAIGARWVTRG